MDLEERIRQPPPRGVESQDLAAARQRLKTQALVTAALIGAPCLFMAVLAVVKPRGSIVDALSMVGCVGGFMFAIVGLPLMLFFRQDLTQGRALLSEGVRLDAKAVEIRVSPKGLRRLEVSFLDEGSERTLHFIITDHLDTAQRAIGQTVSVLRHPKDPELVGLVLPGAGIITTR